ncbi:MAG: DUF6404 family protein [Pseudoxanthomonas sp.]
MTRSEFESRLTKALEHLEATGMRRSTYAPPMFRLFWKMGVQVPPPHMNGFIANVVMIGVFFAVFWGLVMWLILWFWQDRPFAMMATVSAVTGLLFGVITASSMAYQARQHDVPRWQTLGP